MPEEIPSELLVYEKGSTFNSPAAGRGLASYESDLGFKRAELEGKRVLDLGSGPAERFSKEVKAAGIKAVVISLNPDYSDPAIRSRIKNNPSWDKLSIAGVGQALPFADKSFDLVLGDRSLSLYSDPTMFSDPAKGNEILLLWGQEVARVLTEGGVARFTPIVANGLYEPLIIKLKSLGLDAYIEHGEVLVIKKPFVDKSKN